MLEFDVTESRKKLRDLRKSGVNISFSAWIIKVIGSVLQMHPEASAYVCGKKKVMIFNDINISILVEKKIGDNKVPIPMVRFLDDLTNFIETGKEIPEPGVG